MTTKKPDAGERPADLDPQAVWPPRATTSGPVTITDAPVVRTGDVPEGGLGVRIGKVPMPGGLPRTDHVAVPTPTTTTRVPTVTAGASGAKKKGPAAK